MVTCTKCNGAGSFYSDSKEKVIKCPICEGEGDVDRDEEVKEKMFKW